MHSIILEKVFGYAQTQPQKIAVASGENCVSYGELAKNVFRAANMLRSKGVRCRDRIILSAQKGLEYVYCYLGAQLIGAVNVVVDSNSEQSRLKYIENATRPTLCIGYVSSNVESCSFEGLEIPRFEACMPRLDTGLTVDDVAEIMFTTGTTGVPKGACLSHFNIYSSASNINAFIGNGPDEIEVLALPICHSFGLGRLRCNLIIGATIVLQGSFANIPLFFKMLDKWNATMFGMVPAAWAYIRKMSGTRIARFSKKIKYIEIGSAAMPLQQKRELCELFPQTRICHHYGLTEASRCVFMEYHESFDDLATIGKEVCDAVTVRVMDDNGKEAPIGSPGEICVRGNMVLKSYLTEKDSCDAFWDDYFRTGDIGVRKDNGKLYLLGRKKEMINVGGRKVNPVEIEDLVVNLGVEDCVCVAVPDPNGILGEVPKLCVLNNGTKLSLNEIKSCLQARLEAFKVPVVYAWIDRIPKTASGKKQRLLVK